MKEVKYCDVQYKGDKSGCNAETGQKQRKTYRRTTYGNIGFCSGMRLGGCQDMSFFNFYFDQFHDSPLNISFFSLTNNSFMILTTSRLANKRGLFGEVLTVNRTKRGSIK